MTLTKAEKTRKLIIAEAARIFNQKGYAGTSMNDIMKATGLSKGGLYGNFNNKEQIAVAAFEHAVSLVTDEVRVRTKELKHPAEKLKAVVHFYRERILNPPVEGGCPIQNTSIDADDNNPVLRERVIQAVDDWTNRMIYILEKGKGRGQIRPDLDSAQFATQFIGTLEGGIMLAQLYKNVVHFDTMAQLLLKMIAGLTVIKK